MKILIVRSGRAGDMVMCTPALSALLAHYPGAEFTILTSSEGKRILDNFSPRIKHSWIYNRGNSFGFFIKRKMNQVIIKAEFDAVFCFEYSQRYHRLFENTSAVVYGLGPRDENKHYAQLLLDVVSRSVKKNVGFYPLYLPVEEGAKRQNKALMESCGITDTTVLVALHPTFSGIDKRRKVRKHGRHKIWPASSYARLADCLHRYAGQKDIQMRVVMNLLPEEKKIGATIVAQSREGIDILSPEPNFKHYLAFLQRVDLLVSPDTGPMHFAAAVGTPLIALFSGKDPRDCGPFGRNETFRVLRAEDSTPDNAGIAAIRVEQVFQVCREQLAGIHKG